MARPGPHDAVRAALAGAMTAEEVRQLPRAYFRIGDVLVLELPLPGPERTIAEAYARALGMRSVLGRTGGVEGEFRAPQMRLLWGDPDTVTTHTEMGVRFRLDPARIMWSPGNLSERQRLAAWDLAGETVVDLFAGIGYLCLPLAVHARPQRILAIEKSPQTFAFLSENVRLNSVEAIVTPILGDCRDVAPRGVADRVLMGLLPDSLPFLDVALGALKPSGGNIHVHRVAAADQVERSASEALVRVADLGRRADLVGTHVVKSFGPGRDHVVFDLAVKP